MLTTFTTEVKEVWKSLIINPVPFAFQPKSVGNVFYWELQPNEPKPFLVEMAGPNRTRP